MMSWIRHPLGVLEGEGLDPDEFDEDEREELADLL